MVYYGFKQNRVWLIQMFKTCSDMYLTRSSNGIKIKCRYQTVPQPSKRTISSASLMQAADDACFTVYPVVGTYRLPRFIWYNIYLDFVRPRGDVVVLADSIKIYTCACPKYIIRLPITPMDLSVCVWQYILFIRYVLSIQVPAVILYFVSNCQCRI